ASVAHGKPDRNCCGGRIWLLRSSNGSRPGAYYSGLISGGSACKAHTNVTVFARRGSSTSCCFQFEFLARVASRAYRRQRTEAPTSSKRKRRSASACSFDFQSFHASALACGSNLPRSALRRAAFAPAALSHFFDRNPNQL